MADHIDNLTHCVICGADSSPLPHVCRACRDRYGDACPICRTSPCHHCEHAWGQVVPGTWHAAVAHRIGRGGGAS